MENEILKKLAEAWNLYIKTYPMVANYPSNCDDDLQDFRKAIHDAQRIVMVKEGIKKP